MPHQRAMCSCDDLGISTHVGLKNHLGRRVFLPFLGRIQDIYESLRIRYKLNLCLILLRSASGAAQIIENQSVPLIVPCMFF